MIIRMAVIAVRKFQRISELSLMACLAVHYHMLSFELIIRFIMVKLLSALYNLE